MVLGRLPLAYSAWRAMSVFRHGEMDDPAYALGVVRRHLEHAGFRGRTGFTALEIGPGDSLASMVVANVLGLRAVASSTSVRSHGRTSSNISSFAAS
jgi:hypothetical protein